MYAKYWSNSSFQSKLSQPQFEIEIQRNRHITLNDMTNIYADLHLPKACEGSDGKAFHPVPALLCWSPFGKEVQAMALERKPLRLGQSLFDMTIEVDDIEFFVRRGYAVVTVSPRGIGNSQGVNKGPLSLQDQEDCCEAIRWICKQAWCDGNVGMMGTGFSGRIQPLVAAMRPAGLRAIMPVDLIDDLYRESYEGGVTTDYAFAIAGLLPANHSTTEAECEMDEALLRERLRELRERDEIKANSYFYRGLDSWPLRHFDWNIDCLLHDADSNFWQVRSAINVLHRIDIPVYCATYYYDYGRNTASAFNIFCDERLNVPKKLMLIESATEKRSPDIHVRGEKLRWYDHWLKGIDTGIMDEPPVKLFVMGEGCYLEADRWPLDDVEYTRAYLNKDEKLDFQPGEKGCEELIHRPPTQVSQCAWEIPVLEYTGDPFEEDVTVIGSPSVSLFAELDAEDANFLAFIWDVDEGGRKVLLSSGFLKASCKNLLEGSTETAPLNDIYRHLHVEPGMIERYTFPLPPVANTFRMGHRIQLQIKSMDFPVFNPRLKRSYPLFFPSGRAIGPQPETRPARYQIYHGQERPSCLLLPIVKSTSCQSKLGKETDND